jgi:hypothetical protein
MSAAAEPGRGRQSPTTTGAIGVYLLTWWGVVGVSVIRSTRDPNGIDGAQLAITGGLARFG